MKRNINLIAFCVFGIWSLQAQHQQIKDLPSFDKIEMDGNIRLYLSQAEQTSMAIKARKAWQAGEYTIEVQNQTLYVRLREDHQQKTPKITIYLKHTGIRRLKMDGFLKVTTVDPLIGEHLSIEGDGLIKGDIEVAVRDLKVDLDGLCTLHLSGTADRSDLRVDGLGKIKARELVTNVVRQSSDGLASIRVGN